MNMASKGETIKRSCKNFHETHSFWATNDNYYFIIKNKSNDFKTKHITYNYVRKDNNYVSRQSLKQKYSENSTRQNCIVMKIEYLNILYSIVEFLYNSNPEIYHNCNYDEVYDNIKKLYNKQHIEILKSHFKKIYKEHKNNFNNIYNKEIIKFCDGLKELNNVENIKLSEDDDNYYYDLIDTYKKKIQMH
jgi:hypothetical protein